MSGIPLNKPPYAVLTAIDLNKGEIAWQMPLGEGSPALRNNPLLKDVALPDRLGSDSKGGAMVTAGGLVFIGGGDSYFYAFDKKTGREVWRGEVPVRQYRHADDVSHEIGRAIHRDRHRIRQPERAGRTQSGQLNAGSQKRHRRTAFVRRGI